MTLSVLSDDVCFLLLHVWLDMKDLTFLDSAHCLSAIRPSFLKLLASPYFGHGRHGTCHETDVNIEEHQMNWIVMRGVPITELIQEEENMTFKLFTYLLKTHQNAFNKFKLNTSQVKMIAMHFYYCDFDLDCLMELINSCPKLQSLKLSGVPVEARFADKLDAKIMGQLTEYGFSYQVCTGTTQMISETLGLMLGKMTKLTNFSLNGGLNLDNHHFFREFFSKS